MKIYVGHSKQLDYKDELYKPLRESKLDLEHEIILPHEVYAEAKDFVTKEIVKTCDVMLAEVTFPATGLGIELGIASSFDRKIICMHKKGSKISGSLNVICDTFIEYSDQKDMIEKLDKALAN